MEFGTVADWAAVVAAASAALAAIFQLRATQRQTAANLFEQRFRVYRNVIDASGQLNRGTFSDTDRDNLREASHVGAVLFRYSLGETFRRAFDLASKIQRAKARKHENPDRTDLDQEIDADRAQLSNLLESVGRLMRAEMTAWRD